MSPELPEPPARAPVPAILMATVGGVGFMPVAPGTFGSAVGLALSALTSAWPLAAKLGVLAVVTLAAWWASEEVGKAWGHDHQRIVVDEVAGQCLTLLSASATWASFAAGFVLFRFFDIVKPQPARYFDEQKGGWSTLADDLVAGLYALAALAAFEWFF